MSKKKRFKKKTLGRLQMFFEKKPYTGFKNIASTDLTYNCLVSTKVYITQIVHYNNVTKKKIYYPHYPFC